jgi:hypothetical protein
MINYIVLLFLFHFCPTWKTYFQVVLCLYVFQHVFDYKPGEIFGCVADVGWITGHSYVVYGPLVNGGTTVLFESTPIYPNPGKMYLRNNYGPIRNSLICLILLCNLFTFSDHWTIFPEMFQTCFVLIGQPKCPIWLPQF